MTLPGTDHACFHTAVIDMTPRTWAIEAGPLCEYSCSSRPSVATSVMVRGQDMVIGNVDRQYRTTAADSGKRAITNKIGA